MECYIMAVKKLIYKHLNDLGFTKCGHTCIKRIGDTNYYGLVAIERDRHSSYNDERESIESGMRTVVSAGRTFYDIRCDVVYTDRVLSPKEMKETFKETDVTYSLNEVQNSYKYKFYKKSDEDDNRVVANLLDFFYEYFYEPVYTKKGRRSLASDDNVSLFTYLKAFYNAGPISAEYFYSETLCRLAFDEGKYEDALYYAKRTLVYYRPGEFEYNYALENFSKVYNTIKNGEDIFLKEIIYIYDSSAKKLYQQIND